MSLFQITLKAQELAALREVVDYLDDELTAFEQRGRPKAHIGLEVKTLAAALEQHDTEEQCRRAVVQAKIKAQDQRGTR